MPGGGLDALIAIRQACSVSPTAPEWAKLFLALAPFVEERAKNLADPEYWFPDMVENQVTEDYVTMLLDTARHCIEHPWHPWRHGSAAHLKRIDELKEQMLQGHRARREIISHLELTRPTDPVPSVGSNRVERHDILHFFARQFVLLDSPALSVVAFRLTARCACSSLRSDRGPA